MSLTCGYLWRKLYYQYIRDRIWTPKIDLITVNPKGDLPIKFTQQCVFCHKQRVTDAEKAFLENPALTYQELKTFVQLRPEFKFTLGPVCENYECTVMLYEYTGGNNCFDLRSAFPEHFTIQERLGIAEPR